MRTTIFAAASLVAATAAFAQTSTTPAPTTPAPMTTTPGTATPTMPSPTMPTPAPSTAQTTGTSQDGMRMAPGGMDTVRVDTAKVAFMTVMPTDTVTSRLRGVNVVNRENQSLGEVEDFVIKDGRTISGVILSVGGFLGFGERYVAVQPSALTLVRDGSGMKAVMNTTKDDLNNAPKFEYSRVKN